MLYNNKPDVATNGRLVDWWIGEHGYSLLLSGPHDI